MKRIWNIVTETKEVGSECASLGVRAIVVSKSGFRVVGVESQLL